MTTCLFPAIIINVARGNTPETMGERLNGIQEVSGSIPLISTKRNPFPKGSGFFLLRGYFYHIQPQVKLGKVDVEINM